MPLYLKQTDPLMGIWKVEESPADLLNLLSRKRDYAPFLENIRTEGRKQEWLAVRVLLKELLGEEALIAYHNNGAPYLVGMNMTISISHTKGYVAVLLHAERPVGIDIEYRGERILKIRKRFLSLEEDGNIDTPHEAEHLLIYWCAKEALFKTIGRQDVDFRKQLHIAPFPYSQRGCLIATEIRTLQTASYQMSFIVYEDFVLVYTKQ
ncbi:MAG: 4'-phosphopantetheinyl transferase superfamily protein [Tannerellaceae bacterium]|jgi:phosphopantetheinyl transferase|nr:4'-phosphopantetheinyl transferase superfamily protein [Tannerellaceae bacterium]